MAFHARKIVLVQIGSAAEEYECALLNVHKCVWIIASQWIGNNWNQKTKISTLSRWTGSVLFIYLSQHSLWVQGIKAEKNLHSITKWALKILRVGIVNSATELCVGSFVSPSGGVEYTNIHYDLTNTIQTQSLCGILLGHLHGMIGK